MHFKSQIDKYILFGPTKHTKNNLVNTSECTLWLFYEVKSKGSFYLALFKISIVSNFGFFQCQVGAEPRRLKSSPLV